MVEYVSTRLRNAFAWGLPSLLVLACSSDEGDSSSVEGSGTGGVTSVAGGGPGVVVGGTLGAGAVGTGATGGEGDACTLAGCGPGQRCEAQGGKAECIDNTCEDLACEEDYECRPAASGGNVCQSLTCSSDVDCPPERYCDQSRCRDDLCVGDARRCDGDAVAVCESNGSEERSPYACASLGSDRFASECTETSPGVAGCSCEDDWDCPEFTACEAGVCTGTGAAPSCTVPAARFEDVLPQLEFRWGGKSTSSPLAPGKSFTWSSQVASTPLVVNLDDDNGDGRINELDFPEIVFITYHDQGLDDGIVRAIHAGGPKKGQDFFAVCGAPARPDTPEVSYSDAAGTYWSEGAPLVQDCDPNAGNESRGNAVVLGGSTLAAGDLDADGTIEIVAAREGGGLLILSNRGEVLVNARDVLDPASTRYAAPAIANLDFDGRPEIIVGNRVVALTADGPLAVDRVLSATGTMGITAGYFGPLVCLADLTPDPGLEIVAGTSLYRMPPRPADCDAANADSEYCQGELLPVWSAADLSDDDFNPEGYCAVADVLGEDTQAAPSPDNPLDGVPEVIVVADGHVLILDPAGSLLRNIAIPSAGVQGGAPNVDDFDGDGFPEIATALETRYAVVDLQEPEAENCAAWPELLLATDEGAGANPERDPGAACSDDGDCNAGAVCNTRSGRCVCLHNGWMRDTEDDSSRATSSSVFDFNGDGAAEVAYTDECYFRVYDGSTGAVNFAIPSLSRTVLESPIVADVDNDGNAEIVIVQNNETVQCDEDPLDGWPDGDDDVRRSSLPNGLEVWGDPSDVWVAARRIWNQHGYHVTNVLEDGGIPDHEPESWRSLNGRLYNTYRSQPRAYDVAPDLQLEAVQVSSPDTACGELSDDVTITVLIRNEGDLRVGPGVTVEFFGTWAGDESALLDASGEPLVVTLSTSLEPGSSTLVTAPYAVGNNPAPNDETLPDELRVTIDGGNDAPDGSERECDETNNDVLAEVAPGQRLPDLELELGEATCGGDVSVTVTNVGSQAAAPVPVRLYAGDPSAGGEPLDEVDTDVVLAPGESVEVTFELGRLTRNLTLWAVADPANAVYECNDANNSDSLPLPCGIVPK